MDMNSLNFEQPFAELEAKIQELRSISSNGQIDMSEEIARLEERSHQLKISIFSHLKVSQIVQLARHPQRPYTLDYISLIFTDFDELNGDRHFGKGTAIIGGIARFDEQPVMVLGHQKGRKTNEKVERNFGMARPEDYRKTLRLLEIAERFKLPVFTFIDTAGAYPGMDAEEHNQSEAIARNLFRLSKLKVPIICTITGEGGSGGALGIAVGDRILMLQYSFYSVISPEGCAAILWKDAKKAPEAAEALNLTADRLLKLKLIDQIIKEPLGGAHRNPEETAKNLKQSFSKHLAELSDLSSDQLLKQRYKRLMAYGQS
jgi:acetyl-CoA carboxylase carboxyl transferase subunit alpha